MPQTSSGRKRADTRKAEAPQRTFGQGIEEAIRAVPGIGNPLMNFRQRNIERGEQLAQEHPNAARIANLTEGFLGGGIAGRVRPTQLGTMFTGPEGLARSGFMNSPSHQAAMEAAIAGQPFRTIADRFPDLLPKEILELMQFANFITGR